MKKLKPKRRHPISRANKLSPKDIVRLAACGTVGLAGAHQASAETLITFGGFTDPNLSIAGIVGYGDNVTANSLDYTVSPGATGITGTPDITLDWLGQWDTYTGWDGRGEVAQSDFNGGPTVTILFTPDFISAVRLVSYDLDEWVGGGAGSIAWSIDGMSGGTLASGNWTMGNAGGRTTISPNVTGFIGDPVSLTLTINGGAPSYFALDNLVFDQVDVVPEPSTLALGILGAVALGAAAMRRRRSA